jgi:hypothetical protein
MCVSRLDPNPRLERAVRVVVGAPRVRFAILHSRRAGRACGRPLKLIVRRRVVRLTGLESMQLEAGVDAFAWALL